MIVGASKEVLIQTWIDKQHQYRNFNANLRSQGQSFRLATYNLHFWLDPWANKDSDVSEDAFWVIKCLNADTLVITGPLILSRYSVSSTNILALENPLQNFETSVGSFPF